MLIPTRRLRHLHPTQLATSSPTNTAPTAPPGSYTVEPSPGSPAIHALDRAPSTSRAVAARSPLPTPDACPATPTALRATQTRPRKPLPPDAAARTHPATPQPTSVLPAAPRDRTDRKAAMSRTSKSPPAEESNPRAPHESNAPARSADSTSPTPPSRPSTPPATRAATRRASPVFASRQLYSLPETDP